MRRLVAERGELGEDHSECISDCNCSQELLRRMAPGRRTIPPGEQTSEFNGKRRPSRKVVDSPSRGPGRHQRVRKRPRIIDRCEAEGVTNTWTYGRSAGAIQIWDGSPSRASTSSGTPPHTESKDSGGG